MGQFPSLNQEDLAHFDAVLQELLAKSEAQLALRRSKALTQSEIEPAR